VIGLEHSDHGVMEATIGVGQTDLPEATNVAIAASPSSEPLSATAQAVAWSAPGTVSSDGAAPANINLRSRTLMRPGLFTPLTIRVWPHRSPWRPRSRPARG
jgi:hypothetical protein